MYMSLQLYASRTIKDSNGAAQRETADWKGEMEVIDLLNLHDV